MNKVKINIVKPNPTDKEVFSNILLSLESDDYYQLKIDNKFFGNLYEYAKETSSIAFEFYLFTGRSITKEEAEEAGYTEAQRQGFNAALEYGRKQGGDISFSEDLQGALNRRGLGTKKTNEDGNKVITVTGKK